LIEKQDLTGPIKSKAIKDAFSTSKIVSGPSFTNQATRAKISFRYSLRAKPLK